MLASDGFEWPSVALSSVTRRPGSPS